MHAISLDGKKIIFIGDSFVYYGKAVLDKSESRYNDKGYFYQICKNNGCEVSVTNWTYGGKSIQYIYDHYMAELTDRYYDYVIINFGRHAVNTAAVCQEIWKDYIDFFRSVNPNVKFFALVGSGCHNISVEKTFPVDLLNNLSLFENMGIKIVDWGKLVADVIRGEVVVPQAEDHFDKNSFIVHRSDKDGYHPNMLTGYVTALMTYCAMTGESAVGQRYDFCCDTSVHTAYDANAFIALHYQMGSTNFAQIFESEKSMSGLQILIDRYLAQKEYRDYRFSDEDEA